MLPLVNTKIKCAYKVRLMSVQVSLPECAKLRELPSYQKRQTFPEHTLQWCAKFIHCEYFVIYNY